MKRISASDAKNNFGGLLEDVADSGGVEIIRHSRLVAVMLSPRAFKALLERQAGDMPLAQWGEKHMIPPHLARAAKMVRESSGFDEE